MQCNVTITRSSATVPIVCLLPPQASRDLTSLYKTRCSELKANMQRMRHHRGALLYVGAASLEAVLLCCLPNARNNTLATANIRRVDVASEGVSFSAVQQMSLDVSVTDAAVHMSGIDQVGVVRVLAHKHGCTEGKLDDPSSMTAIQIECKWMRTHHLSSQRFCVDCY